jgi:hypothetical protein
MSLILDGTNGLSDVDGSAATPAIRGSDANTGVFFGTDIVGVSTGGTERVRVDASGNVGIGTSSPSFANFSAFSSGLEIKSANTYGVLRLGGATGEFYVGSGSSSVAWVWNQSNSPLIFGTNNTERARIDSSGNLLVGTTSTVNPGSVTGTSSFKTSSSGRWAGAFENAASSSPWGVGVTYTGAAPNNNSNAFFYGKDTGGDRFFMRSNGGLANYSANNANLSDRREKTNFAPAKSYLDVICAIPVQTFNYIDQNMEEDGGLTLGVVAQDVQEVAPELVMESNWGTEDEPKVRLSIYQTDLQYALMKCIQEQQAIITALTARVEALEGTQP